MDVRKCRRMKAKHVYISIQTPPRTALAEFVLDSCSPEIKLKESEIYSRLHCFLSRFEHSIYYFRLYSDLFS